MVELFRCWWCAAKLVAIVHINPRSLEFGMGVIQPRIRETKTHPGSGQATRIGVGRFGDGQTNLTLIFRMTGELRMSRAATIGSGDIAEEGELPASGFDPRRIHRRHRTRQAP